MNRVAETGAGVFAGILSCACAPGCLLILLIFGAIILASSTMPPPS